MEQIKIAYYKVTYIFLSYIYFNLHKNIQDVLIKDMHVCEKHFNFKSFQKFERFLSARFSSSISDPKELAFKTFIFLHFLKKIHFTVFNIMNSF